MSNPFEAIGSGKFKFFNSEVGFSGEERAILGEVKRNLDYHDVGKYTAAWFDSLSDDEIREYERLANEVQSAIEDLAKFGCYDLRTAEKPRPDFCACPTESNAKSCAQCKLQRRYESAMAKENRFNETHGNRICNDCVHYCKSVLGQCDFYYECKHLNQDACEHFHIETDDEYAKRNHTGIYADKNGSDSESSKCSASSSEMRRRSAEKIASRLASELSVVASLMKTMPQYYEKLYADFPDVFAKTNYKTFADLKRACETM